MATETIGGGMTSVQVKAELARGDWKAIVRTPEQQAEYDRWVEECLAASAAERKQWRDEAMKNPVWRTVHWLFQTPVWKEYKAEQKAKIND